MKTRLNHNGGLIPSKKHFSRKIVNGLKMSIKIDLFLLTDNILTSNLPSMNNYQEGHCHLFAALLYSTLTDHDVPCKYCVIYGHYVDNYDEHFAESLDHCYVKVGKYYYDSRGKNTLSDIRERENSRMNTEEKMESFYYTVRKLTNKINESYFVQSPLIPIDYEQLHKDVENFIIKYNLLNGKLPPR